MSIAHRGTGIGLTACMVFAREVKISIINGALVIYGGGLTYLYAPYMAPQLVEFAHSLEISAPVFFAAKAVVAWPFVFHTCTGIRHLVC